MDLAGIQRDALAMVRLAATGNSDGLTALARSYEDQDQDDAATRAERAQERSVLLGAIVSVAVSLASMAGMGLRMSAAEVLDHVCVRSN